MLVLMCGIPGAGKSTACQNWRAAGAIVISSDTLRAQFGKDENDQSVSHLVFPFMEQMTEYLLGIDKDVVIDTTNWNKKSRAPFIKIAKKMSHEVAAQIIWVPLEVAKARNAGRSRVVPEHVLERMFKGFEMPTVGEVDAVEIFDKW